MVAVGGEFHSTDGFSEGAGRDWACVEYSTERVAGLRERRHRDSGRGKQERGESSGKRFQPIMERATQQEIEAWTRGTPLNA